MLTVIPTQVPVPVNRPWIKHYNFYRPRSATEKQPPASCLGFKMNNVVRNYN